MNALARLGLGELQHCRRARGRSNPRSLSWRCSASRRWWRRTWDWAMRWLCMGRNRRGSGALRAGARAAAAAAGGRVCRGICAGADGARERSRDTLPARADAAAGFCRGVDEPGQPAAGAGRRICTPRRRCGGRLSCGRTWFRAGSTWRFWSGSGSGRTQAEAHLRKALALNPEQVETLVAWCQFRAAEKDLAGAWGWLRWALARNPDHDEAVNMQGILLHMEGRFAEAVAVFERAEALGTTRGGIEPRQLAARSGADGGGAEGA